MSKLVQVITNFSFKNIKYTLVFDTNNLYEYDIYELASPENFAIIEPKQVIKIYLQGNGDNHAFLTLWIENHNGSWRLYCEDHPITKYSKISTNELLPDKGFSLTVDSLLSRKSLRGEVVIVNYTAKNLLIRIDSDDSEETKKTFIRTVEKSIRKFNFVLKPIQNSLNLLASTGISHKYLVYCIADQGQGYTPVPKNGKMTFFLKIPNNRIYISVSYEEQRKENYAYY